MRDRTPDRQNAFVDLIDGAVAGAVATWAMGQITSYLYAREDEAAQQRENEARGGKTAYGMAAEKAADLAGTTLSEDERKRYGSAIHWALGAGAGALYGVARHRVPAARAASPSGPRSGS